MTILANWPWSERSARQSPQRWAIHSVFSRSDKRWVQGLTIPNTTVPRESFMCCAGLVHLRGVHRIE